MRYGIGPGLRYNLPIGPIRVDYGFNPNPRKDEARGAFHFSFGFAFWSGAWTLFGSTERGPRPSSQDAVIPRASLLRG
jgi:hypothetical protein